MILLFSGLLVYELDNSFSQKKKSCIHFMKSSLLNS